MISPWIAQVFLNAIPPKPIDSVVEWAVENVKLPGSARSETFNPNITPWTCLPIECCDDGVTRINTFVGPVQSGKSVAGEIALCRWVSKQTGGDIQYNWEDDKKANERWEKRIERILKACAPVMKLWPIESMRHKAKKGLVLFPHCNVTNQGVWVPDNLDSDSIRFQINEEIHNWEPGRLAKAYKRTTAFWNSIIVNISNAGTKGDQLDQAFQSGTQEHWQIKCPGCGELHAMFTRAEKGKPGGLRYDSDKCKRPDGGYDYNRLAGTVRYEMPCCGFMIHDVATERRPLSLGGQYSSPQNTGAHISHRSFTLEAVSVDYIPWLMLIQEKHEALRALRYGDPEPYKRYLQERECKFWDPEDRPLVGKIVLNTSLKKDRDGLAGRAFRFFALDRQQGSLAKGELPHWWLVIRDVMETGDSLLVFEGKFETDEGVIDILTRHGCVMSSGVADSGDDTIHVYQFCLRHGINAIKGGSGSEGSYQHPDGSRKIFSVEAPLHFKLNAPPSRENPLEEPQFWLYSKTGIRERLHWLRAGGAVKWDVPGDVSESYQKHMEAEEIKEVRVPKTGEIQHVWHQHSERNDLFVCECYIAMLMDMAGVIGAQAVDSIEKRVRKLTVGKEQL